MEVSIAGQAAGLLLFAVLGLGLGLVYDMLRPMRYEGKAAWLWDGIFCTLGAWGCFILSMREGRLGLWDIMAALLVFCLYINFLSPCVLPPLLRIYRLILRVSGFFSLQIKKLSKTVKKYFTNLKNYFIL